MGPKKLNECTDCPDVMIALIPGNDDAKRSGETLFNPSFHNTGELRMFLTKFYQEVLYAQQA